MHTNTPYSPGSGVTTNPSRFSAPRRSLSTMRAPSLLPDISEYAPARSPSPNRLRPLPSVRSVSVASFLSDGTIEIEGFGFDNASDIGDDTSICGESMFEGSVYEGEDRSDLSWKAERILANAKKKLDLCGQNISRARSSLILSPSTTPTSFSEQLEAVAVVLPRKVSALNSQEWKSGGNSSHGRTASESAVPGSYSSKTVTNGRGNGKKPEGLRTIEDANEHPSEIERPQSEMSTSKSTQQMRVLRDQMKDLRGKITSLQQQTRSDSMKRRSISSLRSTPNPYEPHDITPTLDDIKQERTHRGNENWRTIDHEDDIADDYSSRSGTPRPRPFRNSASPFEERHEDREDAFSYDALFYGNGVYAGSNGTTTRPMSYDSDGTNSTATAVLEPLKPSRTSPSTMKRSDSHGSIESFETATEIPYPAPRQPIEPSPPAIASEWLSPAALSPRDDGYHSAPHTPRSPQSLNVPFSKAKAQAMINTPSDPSSIYLPGPETQKSQKRKSSIAIGASTSIDAVLVTSADNTGEIELKLDEGDRDLIERMIEGLGSFCCKMEMERREDMRKEYRCRLECALRVLQGVEVYDDEDDETF